MTLKHRRWIVTVVMVAVAVSLVGYILLIEVERDPATSEGPLAMPTPAPFWDSPFDGSRVTRIIVTMGEETTTVERAGEGWRMVTPQEAEADERRLDGLAELEVAKLRFARKLTGVTDQELADYGLQEPEGRVTVELDDGTVLGFTVGTSGPNGTFRYVQKERDAAVYLVSNLYYLDSILGLVDPHPFPATLTPRPGLLVTPTPGASA